MKTVHKDYVTIRCKLCGWTKEVFYLNKRKSFKGHYHKVHKDHPLQFMEEVGD